MRRGPRGRGAARRILQLARRQARHEVDEVHAARATDRPCPRGNARGRDPSKFIAAVSGGWLKILCKSNLTSLLETGSRAIQDSEAKYAPRSAKA